MISRRDFLRNTVFAAAAMAERSKWVLDTINKTMKESCWLIFKGLTNCCVLPEQSVTSRYFDRGRIKGPRFTATPTDRTVHPVVGYKYK